MPTVHPAHASGKTCTRCKAFKPSSLFSPRKDQPGKLKSWCNPCINEQSSIRYYADHQKSKEKGRLYAALGRARHPERARKNTAAWRARNPERYKELQRRCEPKAREQRKLYRLANREKIRARNAEYRRRNAERIKAYNTAYYLANREQVDARIKKCIAQKPDLYNQLHKAAKHRRKVRLINQGPHERFADVEIFERDEWVCQLCGEPVDPTLEYPNPKSKSLDHVVPIAQGGGHTRANVQLAHLGCNARKRDGNRCRPRVA